MARPAEFCKFLAACGHGPRAPQEFLILPHRRPGIGTAAADHRPTAGPRRSAGGLDCWPEYGLVRTGRGVLVGGELHDRRTIIISGHLQALVAAEKSC